MKMNPVVHFEMPAKDAKRVMKFYSSVFGWENKQYPEMGNYIVAMSTESTDKGPKKPTDIPGIGWWVSFQDSEGNRVSMLDGHK